MGRAMGCGKLYWPKACCTATWLAMSSHALLLTFCISWIFLCGRMWWTMDRHNTWQRHAVAIAAGLGAGAFYFIGTFFIAASIAKQNAKPASPTSEAVRVSPRR